MPNIQMRPRRPARPAGMGQKNNDRVRIRNRHYKIKIFLAQTRNIDLKQNGRVVRRKTIYPSARVDENINCLKPFINIKYLCGKFILVVKTFGYQSSLPLADILSCFRKTG